MQRLILPAILALCVSTAAAAQPRHSNLGGGFIEFLFGGRQHEAQPTFIAPPSDAAVPPPVYASTAPGAAPGPLYASPAAAAVPQQAYADTAPAAADEAQPTPESGMDPKFLPREVAYYGNQPPGTIVIDTPHHFLYLVQAGGEARRYGVGVGRPGFAWAGVNKITSKKEWPNWVPPVEMIDRQPYLPRFMAGGPDNPLGARALYIGHTLYRIHGSNAPWTIGHNVSSGCIRMRNADVIDLYNRVKIGTKVVVIGPHDLDNAAAPPRGSVVAG